MLTKAIFILFFFNSLRNADCHGDRNKFHNRAQAVITRDKICSFTSNTFAGLKGKKDHPPDAEFVCEVCTDNATFLACAGNASRCFPRIDIENKSKIPTAFCICIDSDLELNASYTDYVNNGGVDSCSGVQMQVGPYGMRLDGEREGGMHHGGHGGGTHHGGHGGGMHHDGHGGGMHHGGHGSFWPRGPPPPHMVSNFTGFMQTLNESDPILLEKLECCVSQETGLFDSAGQANVTAWHAKADLKPDGTASTAIKTAIDQCATDTTIGCNIHFFMHCIMRNCFSLIQNG